MPYQFSSLTPNLIVADIERSLAFYRDILGFTVEQTVPDVSPFLFAIVRSGPVEVYLNAPAPATEEPRTLSLPLQLADRGAFHDRHMRQPGRRLAA